MRDPVLSRQMFRQDGKTGALNPLAQEMASQGEALGGKFASDMMGKLDGAKTPLDAMNALSGRDEPIEFYFDKLAQEVGDEAAAQTPETVLALVQPVLMMMNEEAPAGLSEMMEGAAGEAEMLANTPMEGPMAQGIGGQAMAMADGTPVTQNDQGIQMLATGGEVMSPFSVTSKGTSITRDKTAEEYQSGIMGLAERMKTETKMMEVPEVKSVQEYFSNAKEFMDMAGVDPERRRKDARANVMLDIAKAALSWGAGVDPNTGENMADAPLGAQLGRAVSSVIPGVQEEVRRVQDMDQAMNMAAAERGMGLMDRDEQRQYAAKNANAELETQLGLQGLQMEADAITTQYQQIQRMDELEVQHKNALILENLKFKNAQRTSGSKDRWDEAYLSEWFLTNLDRINSGTIYSDDVVRFEAAMRYENENPGAESPILQPKAFVDPRIKAAMVENGLFTVREDNGLEYFDRVHKVRNLETGAVEDDGTGALYADTTPQGGQNLIVRSSEDGSVGFNPEVVQQWEQANTPPAALTRALGSSGLIGRYLGNGLVPFVAGVFGNENTTGLDPALARADEDVRQINQLGKAAGSAFRRQVAGIQRDALVERLESGNLAIKLSDNPQRALEKASQTVRTLDQLISPIAARYSRGIYDPGASGRKMRMEDAEALEALGFARHRHQAYVSALESRLNGGAMTDDEIISGLRGFAEAEGLEQGRVSTRTFNEFLNEEDE